MSTAPDRAVAQTTYMNRPKNPVSKMCKSVCHFCGKFILLQMGHAYKTRFQEFSNDMQIERWRTEQQQEWDRLSTMLGLLAVMHLAALAVPSRPPLLAFSVWVGGAGVSACGIFLVQYLAVKAFNITDDDMRDLVRDGNPYLTTDILAAILAAPVLGALWSVVLLFIGLFDYAIEGCLGGARYQVLALIPIVVGLIVVLATVIFGEIAAARLEQSRVQEEDLCHPSPEQPAPQSSV